MSRAKIGKKFDEMVAFQILRNNHACLSVPMSLT